MPLNYSPSLGTLVTQDLAQTLVIGNNTGGTDIIMDAPDLLLGQNSAGILNLNSGSGSDAQLQGDKVIIQDSTAANYISVESGQIKYEAGAGDHVMDGKVVITPAGGNALEVSGDTFIDNNTHDAKVGINKAAPTVSLDVVGDVNLTGKINGVKVYRALLTSNGTNYVLENSIGSITINDAATGQITLVSLGLFIVNKTFISISNNTLNDQDSFVKVNGDEVTTNQIPLQCILSSNQSFADNFYKTAIEILIYP